ncbi:MAG: glutamate racemase [Bacteroidia bacterium]|nr:glutamate racemase [Bacteroidia bacterium]
MSEAAIGIMDSGFGGLSVWREVQKRLPSENLIYFADSGFCPYGTRPEDEVFGLTHRVIRFLISKGCKLLVIACNTATGVAIQRLRATYDLPFVGMEPALKPASEASKTGVIGVLATENTFKGERFHKNKEIHAAGKELIVQPGYGLVELVEEGKLNGAEAREKLEPLIQPMLEGNVDQLVLGCSHYPFLSKEIKELVGERMNLLDPAPAVSKQVERLIEQYQLANSGDQEPYFKFFSSGDIVALRQFVENNLPEQRTLPKSFEKVLVF